jgi:uncharacterized protein YecE (DUF72 family)
MDFGRLASVEGVDFSLPADHPLTAATLARSAEVGAGAPRLRLGLPVWAHRELVPKLYPVGTRPEQRLAAYAAQLEALEVNSSYHHLPDPALLERWRGEVPPDFRFCLKVPRSISHDPAFTRGEVDRFVACAARLGEHLGPSLLQLPPSLGVREKRILWRLLEAFAERLPLAVELRHPSWFADPEVTARLFGHLAERGLGLVISDVAGRRDVLHMAVSTRYAFVRFVGNHLHPSDYRRLEDWAERLSAWARAGLAEVFFFFHQPVEHECVELAVQLADAVERRGAPLACMGPRLFPRAPERAPQGTLF